MAKKSFDDATGFFVSGNSTVEASDDSKIDLSKYEVPEGYRLVKESKSKRVQLLVTPATEAALKTKAKLMDISLNELCNRIIEDYLRKEG